MFGTQRALLATATPLGAAVGAVCVDRFSSASILIASAAGCALAGLCALLVPGIRSPVRTHTGAGSDVQPV